MVRHTPQYMILLVFTTCFLIPNATRARREVLYSQVTAELAGGGFIPSLGLVGLFSLTKDAGLSGDYDAQSIIGRSVAANKTDWNAASDYDYCEEDRFPGGNTRSYEVLMILGSPYEQLVSIDGKALSPKQRADEQQKLVEEVAKRRSESESQRAERVGKYERSRARDHLMLEQLTQAFNFKVVGQGRLGPNNVYILKARPRPQYHPPDAEANVLTGMRGTLWIDRNSFQWVKVEADVIHAVRIEGFVAEVEPGTRFELEKMAVGGSVWLPDHYSMKSRAKVFLLFNHHSQQDETYFGYRKISTPSSSLLNSAAWTFRSCSSTK